MDTVDPFKKQPTCLDFLLFIFKYVIESCTFYDFSLFLYVHVCCSFICLFVIVKHFVASALERCYVNKSINLSYHGKVINIKCAFIN